MAPQVELSPIPHPLRDAFVERRASVFVGAGLSREAGLPTWIQLMEPLRTLIEGCPTEGITPLEIAQYYLNDFGPRELAKQVAGTIRQYKAAPTEAQRILVKIPGLARIYTTNFDDLLEEACRLEHVDYDAIRTAGGLAITRQNHLSIFKLHGDFEAPETIVITADDFEAYFDKHRALAHRIASELRDNTVLFLGYSFNDPDIRTIMRAVQNEGEGYSSNHYILQLDPAKPVIKELKRRGLEVIALEGGLDHGAAVLSWITKLDRRVREKLPKSRQVVHNLPAFAPDLVGREDALLQVRQALRDNLVVSVVGSPGAGKTSLAISLGHALSLGSVNLDFRYIVWVTAREGQSHGKWLDNTLNTIGVTLGFPVIAQISIEHIQKKRDQIELLLAQSTLLILDNFDALDKNDQIVDWISTIPSPSRVLLTSRSNSQEHIPVNCSYPLPPLTPSSAVELLRRYIEESGLSASLHKQTHLLGDIVSVTKSNPQAMKLAVGIILGSIIGVDTVITDLRMVGDSLDNIFEQLFTWSWISVSEEAVRILLVTPIFSSLSVISREALDAATGLNSDAFNTALDEVLRFGLLEASNDGRYWVHPKTATFAASKLASDPKLENAAKRRCATYYIEHIETTIKRKEPQPRYWNVLVTEKMNEIDPEFELINEFIGWSARAGSKDILVKFVMLLVHYMDSRFLNKWRLEYLKIAVEFLQTTDRLADEALLRIDALGWTYVEDCQWSDAHEQIDAGRVLASRLSNDEGFDLLALANAWDARALIEENKVAEAQARIDEALLDMKRCSSWIRVRIGMAAGDICLKQHQDSQALAYFKNALTAAKEYGGEGGGYQLLPRIGLALLNLGKLRQAEENFKELRGLRGIPIGKLYGDYGLALVAYKGGRAQQADQLVETIRKELSQMTGSNLLATLLSDLYQKLQGIHGMVP